MPQKGHVTEKTKNRRQNGGATVGLVSPPRLVLPTTSTTCSLGSRTTTLSTLQQHLLLIPKTLT